MKKTVILDKDHVLVDGVKYVRAKEWPQYGDKYFYAYPTSTGSDNWENHETDHNRKKTGIFRTREEAEFELLRRESMANRWRPEQGEECFYWHFDKKRPICDTFDSEYDLEGYYLGSVHKTEEECQAWGDKFAHAWKVLLD